MRRALSVVTAILACALQMCAEIIISGTIADESGEGLKAMVMLMEGKRIYAHTVATDEGEYKLSYDGNAQNVTVKVSMLGYKTVERIVPAKTQTLDIRMTESTLLLKEVSVMADKIVQRGDTISYQVGAYKDDNDRTIGEVIKKMPGLEVTESGKISFNGKTVKNFYVEDMDLLQGRYGIATNNVSANDVASVQVYQNHQPVRALKDWTPSDDVTINLKLKSSARGTWSANGMLGGGYKPAMWASEAVAMYFGRKAQTITTYKGNNSGDNVAAEHNSLTDGGEMQFLNRAPLSVVSGGSPGVALKRYMDNRSNTAGTNNIFKLDSLTTLNLSLTYLDDILRNEGVSTTEQYLPTGDYRWITQKISTKSYIHNLSGAATYKKNTSGLYLENALNVKAAWNKEKGLSQTSASFTEGETDVDQFLDNPAFTIDDKVSIIINSGRRAWELSLRAGWNHRPQTLTVGHASAPGQTETGNEARQEYTTDDFLANVWTGMYYSLGNVKLNLLATGNVDVETVTSELNSPGITNNANDYTFGKGDVGIEPRASYNIGESYIEIAMPVNYNTQWLRDKLDYDRNRNWNYLSIYPSLKTTLRFGKSWWGLNTRYYKIHDNSERVATGIVMTDYLSLREYLIDKTMVNKTWYSTIEYHYSNAIAQLFANATASWLRNSSNTLTGYEYEGLVTVRKVYDIPNTSNRYTATANISKGLDFWESTLKLGCNYSLGCSKQIINEAPVDYKAQFRSANLMLATVPAGWMGAALGLAYGESRSYTDINRSDATTVRQYTGRIDFNFFPSKRMVVNVAAEDNYTNLTSGARHAWFGDVRVKYKTGRLDWELELNNIFNRRTFTRVSYNDMDIYRNTYDLRPRNVMLKIRFNIL